MFRDAGIEKRDATSGSAEGKGDRIHGGWSWGSEEEWQVGALKLSAGIIYREGNTPQLLFEPRLGTDGTRATTSDWWP